MYPDSSEICSLFLSCSFKHWKFWGPWPPCFPFPGRIATNFIGNPVSTDEFPQYSSVLYKATYRTSTVRQDCLPCQRYVEIAFWTAFSLCRQQEIFVIGLYAFLSDQMSSQWRISCNLLLPTSFFKLICFRENLFAHTFFHVFLFSYII